MSRFYTEERLNAIEEGRLQLPDWQSDVYVPPLQYLRAHHLPSTKGAWTLPPPGRFATARDIAGEGSDADPAPSGVNPITIAAVALVAFYLFLPTRV